MSIEIAAVNADANLFVIEMAIGPDAVRLYRQQHYAASTLSCILVECLADEGGPYPAIITKNASMYYGSLMLGLGLVNARRSRRERRRSMDEIYDHLNQLPIVA